MVVSTETKRENLMTLIFMHFYMMGFLNNLEAPHLQEFYYL